LQKPNQLIEEGYKQSNKIILESKKIKFGQLKNASLSKIINGQTIINIIKSRNSRIEKANRTQINK
jgi:hypothetical protein